MTRGTETLEPRRLLSVSLEAGVLRVEGTPRGDSIQVYVLRDGPGAPAFYTVSIVASDGTSPPDEFVQYPVADVRSVVVRAGAGDDAIDFAPAPLNLDITPVAVPSRVDAGIGNDDIFGGTSRDFLFGGLGNDHIHADRGDDWADGGWGDDFLSGGPGDDYVSGGLGNDNVYGDDGDDRLSGGPGNDHVGRSGAGPMPSEPGNDLLVGGAGEDWMVGGEGTDRILGGAGHDHFSLEDNDREKLDRTPEEPDDVPILD